jgi:hypothetical protein
VGVDIELLTVNLLRGTPEVATPLGDRIYTDLPHVRAYPLCLITLIDSQPVVQDWLLRSRLQLEIWGGTHKQAQNLMSTVLSTLTARAAVKAYPEGAVTGASRESLAYSPADETLDGEGHSRPRYVAVVSLLNHP